MYTGRKTKKMATLRLINYKINRYTPTSCPLRWLPSLSLAWCLWWSRCATSLAGWSLCACSWGCLTVALSASWPLLHLSWLGLKTCPRLSASCWVWCPCPWLWDPPLQVIQEHSQYCVNAVNKSHNVVNKSHMLLYVILPALKFELSMG